MIKLRMQEEILVEKLKKYHVGKHKAITSKNLRHIGNPREIRSIVNTLRVKGYPICSGQSGYYYAQDSSELMGTLKFLRGYLDNIREAHNGIRDTYLKMRIDEHKEDNI